MHEASNLPIRQYAAEITEAVHSNPVVVVIGETGSGKTTQISQILLEAGLAGDGMIGVTQPRRVAAVSVARRVAEERHVDIGSEVGYAVRFEDRSSYKTRIKYLTDGTLLRELLEDPWLSKYSVLILDEAHERSLNTDILFGLLKNLSAQPRRLPKGSKKYHHQEADPPLPQTEDLLPPLKLVVTSATLDSRKFASYFNNCPVFDVPGRTYPVEIIHSLEDHITDYEAAAIDTAIDIHCNHPDGDILMFLTGQAEIDRAVRALNDSVRNLPPGSCGDLMVLPLYAALPPEMQSRVFTKPPQGVRRCVVATNIAETSVTVDGVVYVIDPGMVKQKEYSPRTGMESLGVVPISRVQAAQRAGRAGRTRPGKCFRLYTKRRYEIDMPSATAPEIQRTSLLGAVLYLKSLPLDIDVLEFDYLDAPERQSLEDALRQLYVLDGIDVDGKITRIGKDMAALPLDPPLARALIEARDLGCLDEMLTVASMLSPEGSVFVGNKGPEQLVNGGEERNGISPYGRELLSEMMRDGLGDHVLLLRLWQIWQSAGATIDWCREVGVDARAMRFAREVRKQLVQIIKSGDEEAEDGMRSAKRQKTAEKKVDEFSSSNTIRSLRKALTIGFANRLARRMPLHNGYRTVQGDSDSVLAQIHPSSAPLFTNEDGLLPDWIVYHELVSTGRVYLNGVCPVEGKWVADVLPKLQGVDVARLSGGASGEKAKVLIAGEEKGEGVDAASGKDGVAAGKRNDNAAVEAARARYLARKAAAAKSGKK